jgi:hypothetical protein
MHILHAQQKTQMKANSQQLKILLRSAGVEQTGFKKKTCKSSHEHNSHDRFKVQ